jgi:hypothetical protein
MECIYRRIVTTTTVDIPGDTAETVAVLANERRPAGYELIQVGEIDVIGFCESCKKPLLETDHYAVDEDLIRVCEPCFETFEWGEPKENDCEHMAREINPSESGGV